MDKRKVDDERPRRFSRSYMVGIVVLLIILVFAVALTLLTPKMGVFDSVIEGMTATKAVLTSIPATPKP